MPKTQHLPFQDTFLKEYFLHCIRFKVYIFNKKTLKSENIGRRTDLFKCTKASNDNIRTKSFHFQGHRKLFI